MPRPAKIWFRKATGWWMVTLDGKQVKLAEGRTAKSLAEQKFHELKSVVATAPEAPTARVCDIIDAFLAWSKIHRSAETNRNHVWYGQAFAEHSGYVRASELKPMHLTRWIDGKGWGPTTQRNARRSIARAFAWAVEEGLLPTNPLRGIRCPRAKTRGRAMTDAEFRTLLRHSSRNFKVLLFAIMATGCRPKEARTLTWDKVREDRWALTEHKTAHKGKSRVIYLTSSMRKLMAVLRRTSTSDHVFVNDRNAPWTVGAMRLRIARVKRKSDLPDDVCAYLLRHAFGTNAILRGIDVATVAELMGHGSLDMISQVYCHLADQKSHLQAAMERATGRPAPSKPSPDAGDRAP